MNYGMYNVEFAERALRKISAAAKIEAGLSKAAADKVESIAIMRRRGMPQWARDIVLEECESHGASPSDVIARGRTRSSCNARRVAIYRIKEAKTKLSSIQIGKWFDRDHASIIFNLARHSLLTGAPRLTKRKLERRR